MKAEQQTSLVVRIGFDSGLLVEEQICPGQMGQDLRETLDACYAGLATAQARSGFHLVWQDPASGKREAIGYSSTRDIHDTPHRNRVIRILNRMLTHAGTPPKFMPVAGCNWRQDLSDAAEVLVRVSDKQRDAVLITNVRDFNLALRAKSSDALLNPGEYRRRKELGIRLSAHDLTIGIVSTDAHSIDDFRREFGACVGDRSLWDDIIDSYAMYILDFQDVVIDEERARQFLESPCAADIRLGSRVTTAGALALSTHKGDLHLNGLASLTTNAAMALAGHHGDLHLNGLAAVSDAVAAALGQHQGDWLSLDGVVELSDVAAAALARHRGSWLSLNGVKHLTQTAAASFARQVGGLSLNGLVDLSDEATLALASHRGGFLHLDSFTCISDEAAKALANHDHVLHLNGLTELSPTAASHLAKHKDDLHLDGLTAISAEAAAELARHKGAWLSLNGLIDLSDEAAEALASHNGRLELNGLLSLSNAAASALARHSERLDLNGLRHLSDEAAHALARHKGLYLHLNGLTELSVTGAKALACYQGAELFIGQLKGLPSHAAADLVQNSNIFVSGELEYCAVEGYEI